MKKFLSIILALSMLACMIPAGTFTAFAKDEPNYFYVENTDTSKTNIQWKKEGDLTVNMWYSPDKTNWTEVTFDADILIPAGDVVYFKGNREEPERVYLKSTRVCLKNDNALQTTSIEIGGDITTLLNTESEEDNDCGGVLDLTPYGTEVFKEFCYSLTSLKNAEKLVLPSTVLTNSCYWSMFEKCQAMTKGPELPAIKLASNCYTQMFRECESLLQAPELPATELSYECYCSMFYGCKALTKAPDLPAKKISMRCYMDMFYECTSLTEAPELPATTLFDSCYLTMFAHCSALTKVPDLPADKLAYCCYNGMFFECTALTEAPALPATELEYGCYEDMFSGCESLIKAPVLPATELIRHCYFFMFHGCQKLNKVIIGFPAFVLNMDTPYGSVPHESTYAWLGDVAETGTLYVPEGFDTSLPAGFQTIPAGWTYQEYKTENYLVEEPNAEENGRYNRRYFNCADDSLLADKVLGEDREVTFEQWYLRTMIQYKDGENDALDVRFVSMLDENLVNYSEAGFHVNDGVTEVTVKTTEANTSFIADGKQFDICDYSESNDYFFLANNVFAKEVLEADPEITVTPYVKLISGAAIEGNPVSFKLSQLKGE